MYLSEMVKQELRFYKQFAGITIRYKTSQGEFIWNRETKNLYYKDNNRKYLEYLGNVAI